MRDMMIRNDYGGRAILVFFDFRITANELFTWMLCFWKKIKIMQAVEALAQIDKFGNLKLLEPLKLRNQSVRIIILLPDDENLSDETWLQSVNQNPAFDFLEDKEENIYSLEDGQPFRKWEIRLS